MFFSMKCPSDIKSALLSTLPLNFGPKFEKTPRENGRRFGKNTFFEKNVFDEDVAMDT